MKKQIKFAAVLAAVCLLLSQAIPVMAADHPAVVSLRLAEYEKDTRQVTIACGLKNGDQVTNGKIRILYDSAKLKLLSDETGGVLKSASCEINDCLTGNKEEGELVAAFASSGTLSDSGELLKLTFQVDTPVKNGEEIKVEVKTEKLAGDEGDVNNQTEFLTFKVGESSGQESEGGQNGSITTGESNKTTQKTVKTGDSTEILPAVVLAGAALVMLAGILVIRNRRNKKAGRANKEI